jgi:hypothetical protein
MSSTPPSESDPSDMVVVMLVMRSATSLVVVVVESIALSIVPLVVLSTVFGTELVVFGPVLVTLSTVSLRDDSSASGAVGVPLSRIVLAVVVVAVAVDAVVVAVGDVGTVVVVGVAVGGVVGVAVGLVWVLLSVVSPVVCGVFVAVLFVSVSLRDGVAVVVTGVTVSDGVSVMVVGVEVGVLVVLLTISSTVLLFDVPLMTSVEFVEVEFVEFVEVELLRPSSSRDVFVALSNCGSDGPLGSGTFPPELKSRCFVSRF